MSRAVFTYGTLVFPEVMGAVTGKAFRFEDGWIMGYARFGVRDAVYPGVVERPGARTTGRVFFDVDERTLARLDRFEDWLYERRRVCVKREGGEAVWADAWIVPAHYASELDERPWDPEHFQREHLAGYVDGCHRFRASDEAEEGD